jgi:hypothetical protein
MTGAPFLSRATSFKGETGGPVDRERRWSSVTRIAAIFGVVALFCLPAVPLTQPIRGSGTAVPAPESGGPILPAGGSPTGGSPTSTSAPSVGTFPALVPAASPTPPIVRPDYVPGCGDYACSSVECIRITGQNVSFNGNTATVSWTDFSGPNTAPTDTFQYGSDGVRYPSHSSVTSHTAQVPNLVTKTLTYWRVYANLTCNGLTYTATDKGSFYYGTNGGESCPVGTMAMSVSWGMSNNYATLTINWAITNTLLAGISGSASITITGPFGYVKVINPASDPATDSLPYIGYTYQFIVVASAQCYLPTSYYADPNTYCSAPIVTGHVFIGNLSQPGSNTTEPIYGAQILLKISGTSYEVVANTSTINATTSSGTYAFVWNSCRTEPYTLEAEALGYAWNGPPVTGTAYANVTTTANLYLGLDPSTPVGSATDELYNLNSYYPASPPSGSFPWTTVTYSESHTSNLKVGFITGLPSTTIPLPPSGDTVAINFTGTDSSTAGQDGYAMVMFSPPVTASSPATAETAIGLYLSAPTYLTFDVFVESLPAGMHTGRFSVDALVDGDPLSQDSDLNGNNIFTEFTNNTTYANVNCAAAAQSLPLHLWTQVTCDLSSLIGLQVSQFIFSYDDVGYAGGSATFAAAFDSICLITPHYPDAVVNGDFEAPGLYGWYTTTGGASVIQNTSLFKVGEGNRALNLTKKPTAEGTSTYVSVYQVLQIPSGINGEFNAGPSSAPYSLWIKLKYWASGGCLGCATYAGAFVADHTTAKIAASSWAFPETQILPPDYNTSTQWQNRSINVTSLEGHAASIVLYAKSTYPYQEDLRVDGVTFYTTNEVVWETGNLTNNSALANVTLPSTTYNQASCGNDQVNTLPPETYASFGNVTPLISEPGKYVPDARVYLGADLGQLTNNCGSSPYDNTLEVYLTAAANVTRAYPDDHFGSIGTGTWTVTDVCVAFNETLDPGGGGGAPVPGPLQGHGTNGYPYVVPNGGDNLSAQSWQPPAQSPSLWGVFVSTVFGFFAKAMIQEATIAILLEAGIELIGGPFAPVAFGAALLWGIFSGFGSANTIQNGPCASELEYGFIGANYQFVEYDSNAGGIGVAPYPSTAELQIQVPLFVGWNHNAPGRAEGGVYLATFYLGAIIEDNSYQASSGNVETFSESMLQLVIDTR